MKFFIFLCCITLSVHAAQMSFHREEKKMVLPQQTQIFLYPTALPVEKPAKRYKIPFVLLYFIDYMCNKFCGD